MQLATQDFTKDFSEQLIVAETVERMAESMVSSVPTIALVEWRLDAAKVLSMSNNVTKQARLLKEFGLLQRVN
jgi:hypothetical protein